MVFVKPIGVDNEDATEKRAKHRAMNGRRPSALFPRSFALEQTVPAVWQGCQPSSSSSPHRRTFYAAPTGRCLIGIYFYGYTRDIYSHSMCCTSHPVLSTLQTPASLLLLTAPGRAPATCSVVWAGTGNQRLSKCWGWDLNPRSRDSALDPSIHAIILNTNIKSTLLQEC